MAGRLGGFTTADVAWVPQHPVMVAPTVLDEIRLYLDGPRPETGLPTRRRRCRRRRHSRRRCGARAASRRPWRGAPGREAPGRTEPGGAAARGTGPRTGADRGRRHGTAARRTHRPSGPRICHRSAAPSPASGARSRCCSWRTTGRRVNSRRLVPVAPGASTAGRAAVLPARLRAGGAQAVAAATVAGCRRGTSRGSGAGRPPPGPRRPSAGSALRSLPA